MRVWCLLATLLVGLWPFAAEADAAGELVREAERYLGRGTPY